MEQHGTIGRGTVGSYVMGFGYSLVLTLGAYLLVTHHAFQGIDLIVAIIVLAAIQLVVQLTCFLHLGKESSPRWNLLVFSFMAIVLVILVVGSLWIMSNLNYRMTPQQQLQYLNDQGGGF